MKTELKTGFTLAVTALLALSSIAWAEHGPGNGGNAVLMEDGKYYLLDFVEAGIERSSHLADQPVRLFKGSKRKLKIRRWASRHLVIFPADTQELILQQLERLESFNPYASAVIMGAIRMHSWVFVNYPLKDVLLDDGYLSIPSQMVTQVAVRGGKIIRIQKQIWEKMDSFNQMGLVFHEALYSLISLTKDLNGSLKQESWKVREILSRMMLANTDQQAMETVLYGNLETMDFMKPEFRNSSDQAITPFLNYEGKFVFQIDESYEYHLRPKQNHTIGFSHGNEYFMVEPEIDTTLESKAEQPLWKERLSLFCEVIPNEAQVELWEEFHQRTVELSFVSYQRPEGEFWRVEANRKNWNGGAGPVKTKEREMLEVNVKSCKAYITEAFERLLKSVEEGYDQLPPIQK